MFLKSFFLLTVCSFCLSFPAFAQKPTVLETEAFKTPYGIIPYVIPEGYCLMDGFEGRRMEKSMNKLVMPIEHSLSVRFFPCSEQRRDYEGHNFPVDSGRILVQYYDLNRVLGFTRDDVLKHLQEDLNLASRQSGFADIVLGDSLRYPPEGFPEDPHGLANDVRPIIFDNWDNYMKAVVRDAFRYPDKISDGFVAGRGHQYVLWFGYERTLPHRVFARVSVYTVIKGQVVILTLTRPFTGPDTYKDMEGDLMPSVVGLVVLQGDDINKIETPQPTSAQDISSIPSTQVNSPNGTASDLQNRSLEN